ncbi:MAG: S-adenosylmethionine:tRNA ribosyltransferase-isomerase [Acidimicrobiia bacterium]|nr:S-adenosylmethionine:tRNA ribosyltransferase-isomerase [Acidimicrobiia bacterium]
MGVATPFRFDLAPDRVASMPPEARGLRRDQVRLLVASPGNVVHTQFAQLADHLVAGDLLVVNTSPTMPAAVDGFVRGRAVSVHFSSRTARWNWTIEVRQRDNSGPVLDLHRGDVVEVECGAIALLEPAAPAGTEGVRLWRSQVAVKGGVRRYLARHGRPIRYGYVPDPWPLSAYQTVFADDSIWPGSAEMASAARPFSVSLVDHLRAAGVGIEPIALHAGVSSLEAHEPPPAEPFEVPRNTAAAVNRTKRSGRRVIAVGTTVTRALESVADDDGFVSFRAGWTDLVLGPDRPGRVVDGIITGWHPPEASHLELLEAVAGRDLVTAAYEAAVGGDYLWHEFGDSCLLLP